MTPAAARGVTPATARGVTPATARDLGRALAAFLCAAVVAGCPAQAALPEDAGPPVDAAPADVADDAAAPDDAPPDAPGQTDACAAEAVETACGDGCDNDGDGFGDGDDPDCVTAFLVTREPADGVLRWRVGDADAAPLHAGGAAGRPLLDAVQLAGHGFAVQRGMTPGRGLYRFDPRPDPAAGATLLVDVGFQPSDVCVIAGRVVVTESGGPRLHAYDPAAPTGDGGAAPVRSTTLSRGTMVRACVAEGSHLYAVVATASGTDDVALLDADLTELTWVGLPGGLDAGTTRLLDLAWDRRTGRFFGLFVGSAPNTTAVTPFTMGGAVAAPVTAPFALATLGTFAP